MNFKQKILIVDGHALVHRAFHALPGLTNGKGFPTGAIYGFFNILFRAMSQLKPDHLAVTFDLSEETFRNKLSGDYKANRKPTHDDIKVQVPKVQEILHALNIPVYQKGGYEADDIIGIITRKTPKTMLNAVLTGDMDLLQLINKNTVIYRLKTGITDFVVYDAEKMMSEYGLRPDQWVDYKALRGDASDNIPGVKGIGEKTALDLIRRYESIEKLYDQLAKDKVDAKPGVLAKLKDGKHYAQLSYTLALIDCEKYKFDEFDLAQAKMGDYDPARVIEILQELNIKALIPKLPKSPSNGNGTSYAADGKGRTAKSQDILIEPVEQEKVEKRAQRKMSARPEKFALVDSQEKLDDLAKALAKSKAIAVDVQTSDGTPLSCEPVGLAVSAADNQAFYVPLPVKGQMMRPDLDLSSLKTVLENPKIEKWGNALKGAAIALDKAGISLMPLSFDTAIAAYLCNPGLRSYDVDSLSFQEFGVRAYKITGKDTKPKDEIDFSQADLNEAAMYGCEDAARVFHLKSVLEKEMKEKKVHRLFAEIEMPLAPVLRQMEETGVILDTKYLKTLSDEAGKEIAKLEKTIYKLAGYEFNISSPAQLREALFDKLQIPTTELKKRGKAGGLSTAAAELEKLRGLHPIIDHIFDYRELTKLKSTYLDALPELVAEDKRLHTSYSQTIAATGRLSSHDPNLQNIPVRTEFGRAIRKAFVAEQGFVLAAVDYSQIELRIAASLSGDPEMTKIFKSGKDFHMATAARIFNVMESQVTPDQRRAAKTINFSVLYGVSAFGLSERSDMGRAEAGEFIKRYYQVFARLKGFIDKTTKKAHDQGFIRNDLGRVRYFPEINASNFAVRAGAERAAFNMPIQSMNADIIKLAMLEIQEKVVSDDCRMLLQVHDELVFEIRKGKEKECVKKIREIMEKAYKLKVPIVAEAKIGPNWLDMERL